MTRRGASMAPPPPPSNAATGKASAPTKPAGISRWRACWWRRAAAASRRNGCRCATPETRRGRAIRWSATAPGRSSRRTQRLEPLDEARQPDAKSQPAALRGLELRRFDDIAEALVVAAHANSELLRTVLQGLQTTLGQAALDHRLVRARCPKYWALGGVAGAGQRPGLHRGYRAAGASGLALVAGQGPGSEQI